MQVLSAKKAVEYFRSTKYNLDSAQAVYAVFFGPYDEKVKSAPLFCGQNGLCGAVYAAVDIRPDLEDIICQEFQYKAGECTCKEIRAQCRLPCHGAVQLAAQILEDYLSPVHVEEEPLWWENDPEAADKLFEQ